MKKDIQEYLKTLVFFALEVGALYGVMFFLHEKLHEPEVAIPLVAALIPILAFYAHRLEKTFNVPYFVWAIGLGYLFKNEFTLLTQSSDTLKIVVELFGILIIFGGGLDVKFSSFKKLLFPIIALSVLGSLLTAAMFSGGLMGIRWLFAIPISIGTIGLLGAMLCSTDPAAIVPTLKRLRLKNPDDATVAISESAVNDVIGTIMTAVFAAMVIGATVPVASLFDLWGNLFSLAILELFFKELLIGIVIGYLAYFLLRLWKSGEQISMAGFPFFIGVAFVAYTLSTVWGGSGFLAAFIAGLLFDAQKGFKDIEHFFINLVDGFVKPSVFILLGALISNSFWQYAWIGILASIVFIVVVRPLSVGISLGLFTGKNKTFRWRDILFFDVIRETGVIPAVLLVSYASLLPDGEIAFAIGAWVILTTLIILPLITGWWAMKIKAAN